MAFPPSSLLLFYVDTLRIHWITCVANSAAFVTLNCKITDHKRTKDATVQLVIGCLGNSFTGDGDIRRGALSGKVVYLGRRGFSWSVRHVPLCMLHPLLTPQQVQWSPKVQGHKRGYRLLIPVVPRSLFWPHSPPLDFAAAQRMTSLTHSSPLDDSICHQL